MKGRAPAVLLIVVLGVGVLSSSDSGASTVDSFPPPQSSATGLLHLALQAAPDEGQAPGPCGVTADRSMEDGNGLLVIATSPPTDGVEIIIDGRAVTTDAEGCVVEELVAGPHVVFVSGGHPGEERQEINGQTRPLRPNWTSPVQLTTGTVTELTVGVDPPQCLQQPRQRMPGAALGGAEPGLLVISTVPRLPGVLVRVDGLSFHSDAEGCVVIGLDRGTHLLSVPDVNLVDDENRHVFGRWDDIWQPDRKIRVGRVPFELQLGIKVQHPVSIEFKDATLDEVHPDRIETARIVNSFGVATPLSEKVTEEDEAVSFDRVWLTANRLRRVSGGLFSDDNVYTFREVSVDGNDVVQSGGVQYIPALSTDCPRLSSNLAQECNRWTVPLLLFPFEVELRSFIFRDPVDASVAVYRLNGPDDGIPLLEGISGPDGIIEWPQVPRGDYEIAVAAGSITTRSPTILTGPKIEKITVMTGGILVFAIPLLLLVLLTIVVGIRRPRARLALAAIWPLVIGFVLSVPNLGAAVIRPLSATVAVNYTDDGAFLGVETTVGNSSPVPIEQSYCAPDFELRVPTDSGIWRATYESPDFHDVETSRFCRIHIVDPGSSRNAFTSTQGQEWVLEGEFPPPGIYEGFVRVFGIPAGSVDLDLTTGLSPLLSFAEQENLIADEIPFTNPFED